MDRTGHYILYEEKTVEEFFTADLFRVLLLKDLNSLIFGKNNESSKGQFASNKKCMDFARESGKEICKMRFKSIEQ